MRELQDAAHELVAHPPLSPKPIDVLKRRAQARLRRRRVGAAVAVAACGAIAAIVGLTSSAGPSQRVVTVGPGPTDTGLSSRGIPAGYRLLTYGYMAIDVPATWRLDMPGLCVRRTNVLYLGRLTPSCTLVPPYATIEPSSGESPPNSPTTLINGQPAAGCHAAPTCAGNRTWTFPQLGETLTVVGTQAETILQSVQPSSAYLLAHPESVHLTVPTNWKTATYQGVSLRVPPTWPILTGSQAAQQGACGAYFSPRPMVIEGEVPLSCNSGPSTSPADPPTAAWLLPTDCTNTGRAAGLDGRTVFCGGLNPIADPLATAMTGFMRLGLTARGPSSVTVTIQLGDDPVTAAIIAASIRPA